VGLLTTAIGHADRAKPLRLYCAGLLMPGERKSVEPMAARLEPDRVGAAHQQMHHFVADAPWSDEKVLAAVRQYALPVFEAHGGIQAWVLDDTGIPKKGKHSVGVTRQYCGVLGKQDNCQVAVSLSVANEKLSLPVAYELSLPETWAGSKELRKKAAVPEDVTFRTKPQIALGQIQRTLEAGVPAGVVLADAGYGNVTELRDGVAALGLRYAMSVMPATTIWPEGTGPVVPPLKREGVHGRQGKRLLRDDTHRPVTIRDVAHGLPKSRYRTVTWRKGSWGPMSSRFCAVRVRAAHRDTKRFEPRPEEWLLIEWPIDRTEPLKYWLTNLPADTPLTTLARTVMLRWRIERDYEELKDELGLDHYEGRGWRGFHHHAVLCIAAYGFLAVERGLFSPSGVSLLGLPIGPSQVPQGFRPRGAPDPSRAARPLLGSHSQDPHRQGAAAGDSSMSVLPKASTKRQLPR
jgi:SRSO17 transposase